MRKCILVDDDRWALVDMRASFRFSDYGFVLAGEYLNAESALEGIYEHQPDLVITDVRMEASSGLDLLRTCRKNGISHAEFIVVSSYDQFSYVHSAINNGALSYLLKPLDPVEANNALDRARSILDAKKQPVDAQGDAFQRMLAYVQLHYAENFTLEQLAQRFGFHKSYLSELFTRHTGMGFSSYKNKLRIEQAQKLLQDGLSVGDTAALVGFEDMRYFSRVFKRATGETPQDWRRGSGKEME